MVFSSLEFIFIFLPIFLIAYIIVPRKYKNTIILCGSIIFYIVGSWKKPQNIFLLLLTTIVNFVIGRRLEKNHSKKLLILGITYNLFWLILYKYMGFFIGTFSNVNLALPIGISFYTFQSISYLIDVYSNKTKAANNIFRYGTYVFMFPQLISGPIVTYGFINKQLEENKKINYEAISAGCKEFILGLGLKVLLANRLSMLWNDILTIGIDSISTKLAWLGIIGYSLQIYFDFYGYSLMAKGIRKTNRSKFT